MSAITLPLIVVAGNGPALLRRNWLGNIQIDWKSIGALRVEQSTERSLQDLQSKYADVFRDELGTVQPMKVKLHVKPDARPTSSASHVQSFLL